MAGGGLPAAFAEACRRDRVLTAARNLMLAQAAEACLRAFAAAGVPVIVLKGLAYERSLYSNDGARPTADVDILVPAEARRADEQALGLTTNPAERALLEQRLTQTIQRKDP